MKNLALLFFVLGLLCSCGGGGVTIPAPRAISVTLAPALWTGVDQAQRLNFTATVANDSSGKGVTWSLSGTGCSGSACGSLTNITATTATYNAPSSVSASFSVSVTAASIADSTKSASTLVVVNPLPSITTTSLPNGTASWAYSQVLQSAGGTGVWPTWSLASGSLPPGLTLSSGGVVPLTGLAFPPTISGTPTAAGKWTFTLKVTDSSATPLSATSALLSITIYNIWAQACDSSGNEAVLSGQYAFTLSGFDGTGYLAVAGAFAADGTGKITAGEVDTNGTLGAQTASIEAGASAYAVGSDSRGCATIATSFGTFNARFALGTFSSGVATEGRVIEWESGSSAYIAAGHILQQIASSFSGGNYAFAMTGWDSSNSARLGVVGSMTTSALGQFTNVEEDINDGGQVSNVPTGVLTGAASSFDTYGRATTTFSKGGGTVSTGTVYMVSASKLLYLQSSSPVVVGEIQQQTPPTGSFSNSSFTGNSVAYLSGLNGGGTGGSADFMLINANGTGSLSGTDYYDGGGTWKTPQTFTCTYSVATNGRMTLPSCGTGAPIFYLFGANQAYALTQDTDVGVGQVEPQTGAPFSTASFLGSFYMGTLEVVNQAVDTGVTVLTVSNGNATMTSDYTTIYGQRPDQAEIGMTTVNSNGTFSTSPSGTINAVLISSTKFVVVDYDTSTYPTLLVGKQ